LDQMFNVFVLPLDDALYKFQHNNITLSQALW